MVIVVSSETQTMPVPGWLPDPSLSPNTPRQECRDNVCLWVGKGHEEWGAGGLGNKHDLGSSGFQEISYIIQLLFSEKFWKIHKLIQYDMFGSSLHLSRA